MGSFFDDLVEKLRIVWKNIRYIGFFLFSLYPSIINHYPANIFCLEIVVSFLHLLAFIIFKSNLEWFFR